MKTTRGTLKKWFSDKGYGFIRPDGGGKDVFVHIRAFGDIGREPREGDVLRYRVVPDGSGRVRAEEIEVRGAPRRMGSAGSTGMIQAAPRPKSRPPLLLLFILSGLVVFAVDKISKLNGRGDYRAPRTLGSLESGLEDEAESKSKWQFWSQEDDFECEGKTRCTEMTSCAEAKFYLKNCPGTRMDGDYDGVPCEDQWCKWW